MRRLMTAATVLTALAAPLPASAGEAETDTKAAELAKNFGDPERQREMALMLRAMAEVMLDIPVAPMVEAVEGATGEKGPKVAPDATLRSLSPDAAGRVPEMIEKGVPAAMGAMGGAARAADAMTPAMREMAERMAPLLEAMAAKMDEVAPQRR